MSCLVAILVLAAAGPAIIDFDALAHFDRVVAARMHPESPWRYKMVDLTALGSGAVATWATVIISSWLLSRGRGRHAVQLIVAAGGAGLWIEFLKPLFERDRPDALAALAWASGHSFPSGHALIATSFYATLAHIAAAGATRRTRIVIWTAAIFTVAIVAMSRVYLRVHFASDVIGGIVIGALWTACVAALISRPAGLGGTAGPSGTVAVSRNARADP